MPQSGEEEGGYAGPAEGLPAGALIEVFEALGAMSVPVSQTAAPGAEPEPDWAEEAPALPVPTKPRSCPGCSTGKLGAASPWPFRAVTEGALKAPAEVSLTAAVDAEIEGRVRRLRRRRFPLQRCEFTRCRRTLHDL